MAENTQLLGISNAVVDVLAHVDYELLQRIDAPAGSMILIDADRATEVYKLMGPATEMSGGSVGNSVAGFANLGGTAAYIGRVADDQLGAIFNHDMEALGVEMRLPPETRSAPTARSHVFITPDGQRTMQTYLGACTEIEPDDITALTIGRPEVVLLEGYVWDTPHGPEALTKAMDLAHAVGAKVALSLSDDQCVLRHHDAFRQAIDTQVDIVVANETEILALMDASDIDAILDRLAAAEVTFAVTRSEKGSVIVHHGELEAVPATPVEKIVDTTGAGDAYTAGFLYGVTHGSTLAASAKLGSACAAQVIQQVGARLEKGELGETR